MELSFTPKLAVEIDYSSVKPEGFDYESRYVKNVVVVYKINLNQRSWGLDLQFMCQDQDIRFEAELEDLNSGETISHNEFKIRLEDVEIELNDKSISSQISPDTMSIVITDLKLENGIYVGKAKGTLSF